MSPTLALSGDFSHSELDDLCAELGPLRDWEAGVPSRIDLSELGSLEPSGLAILLASLRGLRRRQICDPLDDYSPPTNASPAAFLTREALEGLLGIEPHWQRIGEPSALLGCEPFSNSIEIDRMTARLRSELEARTAWCDVSLGSIGKLAFDCAENVMQHAGVRGGVVVARIDEQRQRLTLAVADSGIGIRRSLAQNPRFSEIGDDLPAIREAITAGATGESGGGGGMGLYLARLVVQENGGHFLIRSGDSACREKERIVEDRQLPHLHGTLVSVELHTDCPLDYNRIDEWLETPVGVPSTGPSTGA